MEQARLAECGAEFEQLLSARVRLEVAMADHIAAGHSIRLEKKPEQYIDGKPIGEREEVAVSMGDFIWCDARLVESVAYRRARDHYSDTTRFPDFASMFFAAGELRDPAIAQTLLTALYAKKEPLPDNFLWASDPAAGWIIDHRNASNAHMRASLHAHAIEQCGLSASKNQLHFVENRALSAITIALSPVYRELARERGRIMLELEYIAELPSIEMQIIEDIARKDQRVRIEREAFPGWVIVQRES
jgi:hypothetical protein